MLEMLIPWHPAVETGVTTANVTAKYLQFPILIVLLQPSRLTIKIVGRCEVPVYQRAGEQLAAASRLTCTGGLLSQ